MKLAFFYPVSRPKHTQTLYASNFALSKHGAIEHSTRFPQTPLGQSRFNSASTA